MTNGIVAAENPETYPIVVIQPGSFNLRFGLSTSTHPVVIPHCIGRKRRNACSYKHEDEWLPDITKETDESLLLREIGLKTARESLTSRNVARGRKRKLTSPEQILQFNRSSEIFRDEDIRDQIRPSTTQSGEFVIGQEALTLAPDSPYNVHWPWKGGKLNLHDGVGGSLSSTVQDLRDIWSTAFRTHLGIDPENAKRHRAVLLIPDTYRRPDVREMVEVLLNGIGFHSTFVAQESVCATFEEGSTCACVVDIGDRKSSICCVEDGMIKPDTMVLVQVGGGDVTCCLRWLIRSCGFPLEEVDVSRRHDGLFVQGIKEAHCHLDQNVEGTKDFEAVYRNVQRSVDTKFTLRLGDERILAPMSLFFPEMFGFKSAPGGSLVVLGGGKKVGDPSDVNDEEYLRQTTTRHEMAARQRRRDQAEPSSGHAQESGGGGGGIGDDSQLNDYDGYDPMESNPRQAQAEDEWDVWNVSGLHHSIVRSVERCESEETRQRMLGNILLVGGGAMFAGIQSTLIYLLTNQLRLNGKSYEINVYPKESSELANVAWKGACIMSCLDTSQELWVTSRLWNKYGVRALRERIPFNW